MAAKCDERDGLWNAYQAIVHLNNVGVALLERGCCCRSIIIFEGLLEEVIGLSFPNALAGNGPSDHETVPSDRARHRLQAKLEQASRDLAKVDIVQQNHPILFNDQRSLEISTLFGNSNEMKNLLDRSPASSAGTPVKIAAADICREYVDSRNFDLECAIVLYNLGVSYYVCSQFTQGSRELQQQEDDLEMHEDVAFLDDGEMASSRASLLEEISLSLFQSSLDILANHHKRYSSQAPDESIMTFNAVVIANLVVATAGYITARTGEIMEAGQYFSELITLRLHASLMLNDESDIVLQATRRDLHASAAA